MLKRINKITDFIEDNVHKNDIDALILEKFIAEKETKKAFEYRFSAFVGCSLSKYIRERRFTLAAKDLQKGMTVKEVATKFGYISDKKYSDSGIDAFTKAFKRYFAVPPSECRTKEFENNLREKFHIVYRVNRNQTPGTIDAEKIIEDVNRIEEMEE